VRGAWGGDARVGDEGGEGGEKGGEETQLEEGERGAGGGSCVWVWVGVCEREKRGTGGEDGVCVDSGRRRRREKDAVCVMCVKCFKRRHAHVEREGDEREGESARTHRERKRRTRTDRREREGRTNTKPSSPQLTKSLVFLAIQTKRDDARACTDNQERREGGWSRVACGERDRERRGDLKGFSLWSFSSLVSFYTLSSHLEICRGEHCYGIPLCDPKGDLRSGEKERKMEEG
jgi:hypothetical protein